MYDDERSFASISKFFIQFLTLTNSFIHIRKIRNQVAFSSRAKTIFAKIVFERDFARKISRRALITETHCQRTRCEATIDDTMTTNNIVFANRHARAKKVKKVRILETRNRRERSSVSAKLTKNVKRSI